PLALPQVSQTGTTVWLILPLYARNSSTSDISERREALVGFAIGVLGLDAFVRDVLGNTEPIGSNLSIFDASDNANRKLLFELVDTSGNQPTEVQPLQRTTIDREVEVAGRHWLLVATADSNTSLEFADLLPWCVALVVSLLTSLL